MFAEDLKAWRAFILEMHGVSPHEAPLTKVAAVQTELVLWGAANQVVFDPRSGIFLHLTQESMRRNECLRSQGVFSTALRMLDAAKHVA